MKMVVTSLAMNRILIGTSNVTDMALWIGFNDFDLDEFVGIGQQS